VLPDGETVPGASLDADALRSVLADDVIASQMVPYACPCEFGPGGRYRLEELIAAGTRSLVYRAKDARLSDTGFHAEVAVKVFPHGGDRSHEALSARRVTHPHVLRILDRGVTDDGAAFIVSEYVEGGDLASHPVPWHPRRAAAFVGKLCRAVQAAHAAGVVHCDLKPGNVLVTAEGEPKLADFDLARSDSHTSGAARGNLAYMAPEQFQGTENCLSPPADIYALGGILHVLLTGRPPHGETAAEIASFHATSAPPPPTGLDPTLDAVLARALLPSAAGRYPSAAQMADDLDAWRAFRPIAWMNQPWRTRLRLWATRHPGRAVAAASAATALAGGIWLGWMVIERDHQRELEAQAMIVREADAKVEEIKGKVRQEIGRMLRLLGPGNAEDANDRMLPTLTWIEWLTSDPVISSSGTVAGVEERINLLQDSISHAESGGRGMHLDTMMRRYALAQMLVKAGRSAEAGPVIDALASWAEQAATDDPVRVKVRVMRECVSLELAPNPEAAAARARALRATRGEIIEEPGMARTVALIEAVLKRTGR